VSSDRQFGQSGERYNLEGAGSSRWRQRAFYDYLKDVYSWVVNLPLIRISIYDEFEGVSVDTLLSKGLAEPILEFVQTRVSQVLLS